MQRMEVAPSIQKSAIRFEFSLSDRPEALLKVNHVADERPPTRPRASTSGARLPLSPHPRRDDAEKFKKGPEPSMRLKGELPRRGVWKEPAATAPPGRGPFPPQARSGEAVCWFPS